MLVRKFRHSLQLEWKLSRKHLPKVPSGRRSYIIALESWKKIWGMELIWFLLSDVDALEKVNQSVGDESPTEDQQWKPEGLLGNIWETSIYSSPQKAKEQFRELFMRVTELQEGWIFSPTEFTVSRSQPWIKEVGLWDFGWGYQGWCAWKSTSPWTLCLWKLFPVRG